MAARVKSTINPTLLTSARETAGFTSAEAAKRLKIGAQLAAWEDPADEDAPSIPQLPKVAAIEGSDKRRFLAVLHQGRLRRQ